MRPYIGQKKGRKTLRSSKNILIIEYFYDEYFYLEVSKLKKKYSPLWFLVPLREL